MRHIQKAGTWYRVSCRPHHSWGRKEKLVSTHPILPENAIFQARKIFFNKSICTFLLSLCQPPKVWIIFTQFSTFVFPEKRKKKNRILLKTRKITCLLTGNKYLHQLPWVDCANVEPSQKQKEFQYQDVFYIKP